jgi:hypothetical protein
MHILGERLQSALTVPLVRLACGLRRSSQTALLRAIPEALEITVC